MKTQKNWEKAQLTYGIYTKRLVCYTCCVSILFLGLDIFAILVDNKDILFWTIIIQGTMLCILLFLINLLVNKKIDL